MKILTISETIDAGKQLMLERKSMELKLCYSEDKKLPEAITKFRISN